MNQIFKSYLYPRQKIFGFFLIAMSIVMYITPLFPYKGMPNGSLFGLGYAVCMFGIMFNPILRKKLSVCKATKFQTFMSNFSIAVLVVGVFIIFQCVGINGSFRTIWVLIFGVVGAHFLTFIPVHGKIAGILGLALILNSAAAIMVPSIPLTFVFIIDGTIKLIIGVIFIKVSPINW